MASSALTSPLVKKPGRPRWQWWLLGIVALLIMLTSVGLFMLDSWLRRTLEKQVARQTHGQYHLQIGALHTSLWQRAIRLEKVRLRPAAIVADTLPRLRLDVARLHVTGIGLLAALRRSTVPLDSVVLDSTRLDVLALAQKPTKNTALPLHQRLPLQLEGLAIDYLGLLRTSVRYTPTGQGQALVPQAQVVAKNLLLSPAGAADSQRVAYARDWQVVLQHPLTDAAGHHVALRQLRFSSAAGRLSLDSLRIRPQQVKPAAGWQMQLDGTLAKLTISGLKAALLQHRHRFQADSLLVQSPQLTFATPNHSTGSNAALPALLRQLDLAYLAVREGELRVTGTPQAPVIRNVELTGTDIHLDSAATPDAGRLLFAKTWQLELGRSEAKLAGHAASLDSLHFSSAGGFLALSSVRIKPPAPGQGKPGGARVDLTLPELVLTGWQPTAVQHEHRFEARSLRLVKPKLAFTPPSQPAPPVWKLLAPVFHRADLADLRILGAEVAIGPAGKVGTINSLNLTGRAIRVDSGAADNKQRIAYARFWQAYAERIVVPFDAPYYEGSSQGLYLNTDERTIVFSTLALRPAYSAVDMNLHLGYQAPAITIQVPYLQAKGVDFPALAHQGDVRIEQVVTRNPSVTIASDGRGPINPHPSKITPENMRKLPMIVDVRRFDILNGNLYSRYRSPLTPIPGTLSINRFHGSFLNLSNDPKRQTAATPLTGKASTYLQNQCRLDAQVSMYLLDPQGRHRVWGAFGPGPFSMLNSMTVPTRLVQFKSGNVKRLRFDLQANRHQVTGTMWTEYSGLQLSLLGYKEEEIKKPLLKRVISKAANVIVIRDQNPRKRGELVSGEMTSTREPRFSMFTLWRQGIVSGLFHNVGVPQKLAQKLSETKDEAPLPR
jgi:hypothetical protein